MSTRNSSTDFTLGLPSKPRSSAVAALHHGVADVSNEELLDEGFCREGSWLLAEGTRSITGRALSSHSHVIYDQLLSSGGE